MPVVSGGQSRFRGPVALRSPPAAGVQWKFKLEDIDNWMTCLPVPDTAGAVLDGVS